jgi:tRNA1(Val) A37 N6-methylase TrmN6
MEQTSATQDRPLVTNDAFLDGALSIRQLRSGYRAGLDAVMLAAAVPGEAGRPLRVLDVGAGVGTAGLCVAHRLPFAQVV